MAPEVLRDEQHTEKSDVWAFAITMGEVLTRCTTPYAKKTHVQIVTAVLVTGNLPPVPDDCCPDVPELVPLLHRCRQMEPDQVSGILCTCRCIL